MATIQKLIERIETRLFLVSGIDVQTHAEDQLIEMLRHKYNVLFDDHWYPEYTFSMTATLDGTTGQVVEDLSTEIIRYMDINCVLWDQDETPLPQMPIGSNPANTRTRSIAPSSDPSKVFKLYPVTETGPLVIWYRKRIADSVWDDAEYETVIPMDDEMLLLGCVYEFLFNDGSNDVAIGEYKKMFDARVKQQRNTQFQIPMTKSKVNRDGPATRWY